MTREQVVLTIVDVPESSGIAYMVTGSFASNIYGLPRATQDADFVLQVGETSMGSLIARLGPGFQLDPQKSFETVTATSKYIVHVSDPPFLVELFLLSSMLTIRRDSREGAAETSRGGQCSYPRPKTSSL